MNEFNKLTKCSNGSLCVHDMSKIENVQIDLGNHRMILNPYKVRKSEHQRLAHTLEFLKTNGANLASERVVELAHQPLKKAIIQSEKIKKVLVSSKLTKS